MSGPVGWPLLVSAAEASGDLLGAAVLQGLAAAGCNSVTGIAGPAMRRAAPGMHQLGRVEDLGVAGLIEVIPALPRVLRARRALRSAIERGRPRVAVLIDAPDLHLPLHRCARSSGVRSVQLVCPQFWAWRASRGAALAGSVDMVLCLFRFEVERLVALGGRAAWVGHPIVERLANVPRQDRAPILAVLPGSRRSERARHLGPFLAAARAAAEELGLRVVLSAPPGTEAVAGVAVDTRSGAALLADCSIALVAAGTATLEAALLGVPTVCAAALHPLSALVARRMLAAPFVALPNILLAREVMPEVLQDLDVGALLPPLRRAAGGSAEAAGVREELLEVLGPPGFGARAAAAIIEIGAAA